MLILLAFGAAAADLVGGYLAATMGTFLRRKVILLIAFAGGFVFALTTLEIMPASMKTLPAMAPFLILGGYLLTFAGEQIWCTHHHHVHEDDHGDHLHEFHTDHAGMLLVPASTSTAMTAGMTVHSFFDGVAVAAAVALGHPTDILVCLGVAVHKIPSTFGLSSVALSATNSRKNAMGVAGICAAATLLGVFVTSSVVGMGEEVKSAVLCVAAGSLLYVAATDLLPIVHRNRNPAVTAAVVIGAFVYFLTAVLLRAVGAE